MFVILLTDPRTISGEIFGLQGGSFERDGFEYCMVRNEDHMTMYRTHAAAVKAKKKAETALHPMRATIVRDNQWAKIFERCLQREAKRHALRKLAASARKNSIKITQEPRS
jgi:hypothetical protein